MMKQEHIFHQITDYVLDLLPGGERQRVEKHAAICADCRHALYQESQIGRAVRATLTVATRPPAGRLQQLAPAMPTGRSAPFFTFIWQRQLASLCLLLILLLGGLGLHLSNQRLTRDGPLPSFLAVTATTTNEPTATLAETETASPTQTAVATTAGIHPEITATPAPIPTPVAAILNLSAN